MTKLSVLLLLVLSLSTVLSHEDIEVEGEADPSFEGIDSEQMNQQFMSMRRTACLVLSRYHSNTQKDTIEGIVQSLSPENQQKYINKIYAVAVEKCE
jgi:hypothetical protein